MQLAEVNRVFFVGAGGIGMSALVRYFLHSRIPVAGYDKTPTPLTLQLIEEGADLHFNDDLVNIPAAYQNPNGTLIIYTPAIPVEHCELKFFKESGFEIKKRAEVLGMISVATTCLAVAGTHGKTTTSSILAHILKEAHLEVMAFLGGISEDFKSNFLYKGAEFSVVEADEFDRSFLWLEPTVACITSMDADHLDIYENHQALKDSFVAFTERIKPGGTLVVRNGLPLNGITYGIEDNSDFTIRNLNISNGVYCFDIHTPNEVFRQVQFGKPGHHNVLNALAAFTMAYLIMNRPELLVKALASFKGVERRFSYQIRSERIVYIDDYAHHPTEIDAVAQAIREMHPGKKILAVFQPHLFSRTRDFGADFARSLSVFDTIWLLDIYPAREKPIEGITSSWLLDQITAAKKGLVAKAELIPAITRFKPEILLTIGAGDIGLLVEPIKNAILQENELEYN
jgi:UDP-N-acetylmuramate--alanine ligase